MRTAKNAIVAIALITLQGFALSSEEASKGSPHAGDSQRIEISGSSIRLSDLKPDAVLPALHEFLRDETRASDGERAEYAKKLRKEYGSFLSDWLTYYRNGMQANQHAQTATTWMTYVITVLVHIFLCLGLAAGWYEFRQAIRLRRRANSKSLPIELEIGLNGVALKTTLVGLLIMAASLGLYIVYVNAILAAK